MIEQFLYNIPNKKIIGNKNHLFYDLPNWIIPMQEIPIEIIVLYDAQLVQKEISKKFCFYYKKWLKYYLDFCQKHNFKQSEKESLSYFIKKLKEKTQTDQQQKQAFYTISINYEILSADREKIVLFKNKKEILSSKKEMGIGVGPGYLINIYGLLLQK